MTNAIITPSVSLVNNRPATTSTKIAEHFGKQHAHVIRDIRRILDEVPTDFGRSNFGSSSYVNEQGKEQPMYNVFQDGFVILVMGYTGIKAMKMKLAYIMAFNAMESTLLSGKPALTESTITPDQQCTLKGIVRSLVERGGMYASIWARFNNHFRIAKYNQLPARRFDEAVEYLNSFCMRPALPDAEALCNIDKQRIELNKAIAHALDAWEHEAETIVQTVSSMCLLARMEK